MGCPGAQSACMPHAYTHVRSYGPYPPRPSNFPTCEVDARPECHLTAGAWCSARSAFSVARVLAASGQAPPEVGKDKGMA